MPILFRLQGLIANFPPILPHIDECSTACANSAITHRAAVTGQSQASTMRVSFSGSYPPTRPSFDQKGSLCPEQMPLQRPESALSKPTHT